MTQDDIQDIKDLLNDESEKWRLDVGDWIGYVEELVEEVDRLQSIIDANKIPTLEEAIVANHVCQFNMAMDGTCFVCGKKA